MMALLQTFQLYCHGNNYECLDSLLFRYLIERKITANESKKAVVLIASFHYFIETPFQREMYVFTLLTF